MVQFENEVCEYLRIPSIPKKEWNKKDSFKNGVAVVQTLSGGEAYAVAGYDATRKNDGIPYISKVFGMEPFCCVLRVYVVPAYMDVDDVDKMDLDDESKKNAKVLEKEAKEMENEDIIDPAKVEMPKNEYYFDNIHNDEEGRAFIDAYNKANRIKGNAPKKHETIVMRLGVIWAEQNKA